MGATFLFRTVNIQLIKLLSKARLLSSLLSLVHFDCVRTLRRASFVLGHVDAKKIERKDDINKTIYIT